MCLDSVVATSPEKRVCFLLQDQVLCVAPRSSDLRHREITVDAVSFSNSRARVKTYLSLRSYSDGLTYFKN